MSIVEALYVVKDRCFDLSSGLEALPIQAFKFQRGKETFHRGVIPTITSSTHTGSSSASLQESEELLASVLRSLDALLSVKRRFASD